MMSYPVLGEPLDFLFQIPKKSIKTCLKACLRVEASTVCGEEQKESQFLCDGSYQLGVRTILGMHWLDLGAIKILVSSELLIGRRSMLCDKGIVRGASSKAVSSWHSLPPLASTRSYLHPPFPPPYPPNAFHRADDHHRFMLVRITQHGQQLAFLLFKLNGTI